MFTALQTLLVTLASLNISLVSNEDGTLTVTVIPKGKKDGESALNTPLTLTGTAEELDAEFANIISGYSNKRASLAEQLEATEAILEAAKKESATKATKAVTKSAKSPKAEVETQGDNDDDEENGEPKAASASTASAEAEPKAKPADASNIWE